MGIFFRKSFRVGPIRFNLSKFGLGISAGVRGLRVGLGSRGAYVAGGLKGFYFRQNLGGLPFQKCVRNTPGANPRCS
ncbi:MAG: hypothetical protein DMG13_32490 [Acidobacteria bacterium]|nr:MAG: hypothetical protein DMG13_32490 [Acidobacteriota bacterium]